MIMRQKGSNEDKLQWRVKIIPTEITNKQTVKKENLENKNGEKKPNCMVSWDDVEIFKNKKPENRK